jgi:hypothetical protein
MLFTDILAKYSSYNTSYGTDKITTHSYGDVYNELFEKYKSSANNILEIGFDCGASLQSYSEYFENATIYGIDIVDNMNLTYKINPKIITLIGDATNEKSVNYFNKKFDIIVEDGSHITEHQIKHFMDFHTKVNQGGLYIIEDVDGNHMDRINNSLKTVAEENGFSLKIYDLRHIKNRFDDILFVFKKN